MALPYSSVDKTFASTMSMFDTLDVCKALQLCLCDLGCVGTCALGFHGDQRVYCLMSG